jgi:hypothetical protein
METIYWSPSFFGKYTNGVLSTNFEVGTFFSNSKMEQTAFLFKPTILQN